MPMLQTGLSVLGVIAGLAAWVAVVGGLTMWARFKAAAVPAGEAVSLLPREVLVTEGVHTLAVPLLAGLLAAAAAALVERTRAKDLAVSGWRSVREDGLKKLAFIAKSLVALALFFLFLGGLVLLVLSVFGLEFWWAFLLVVVSLVAFGMMLWLLSLDRRGRPGLVVLSVFSLAALWGGIFGFLYELGAAEPRLETVRVEFEASRIPEWGLFVARTGDAVLLAQAGTPEQGCGLRVITHR